MASLRATARPIARDPPVTIATGVLAVLCAFVITPPLWPRCPAVAQGHLPGHLPGIYDALSAGVRLAGWPSNARRRFWAGPRSAMCWTGYSRPRAGARA